MKFSINPHKTNINIVFFPFVRYNHTQLKEKSPYIFYKKLK